MTDRRRAFGQSGHPGEPGQHDQPGEPGEHGQEDNPYAPPPEDAPDQPWRPRQPGARGDAQSDEGSEDGDGEQSGRSKWGSQWSSRQPRRGSGGFGNAFGNGGQNDDEDGRGTGGPGRNRMRWDPKDPAQRHARYALLAGMWSFFFALFNIPPIALLLGALALYWGVSSLRGAPWVDSSKAATPSGDTGRRVPAAFTNSDNGTDGNGNGNKPSIRKAQRSSAIMGIVVASLGLTVVMSTFTMQLVYKQYYDCVEDSLTTSSRAACEEDHLPERLRGILGEG